RRRARLREQRTRHCSKLSRRNWSGDDVRVRGGLFGMDHGSRRKALRPDARLMAGWTIGGFSALLDRGDFRLHRTVHPIVPDCLLSGEPEALRATPRRWSRRKRKTAESWLRGGATRARVSPHQDATISSAGKYVR